MIDVQAPAADELANEEDYGEDEKEEDEDEQNRDN